MTGAGRILTPPTPSASLQKAPVRRETLSNRPDAAPSTSACQIRIAGGARTQQAHSAVELRGMSAPNLGRRSHSVALRGTSGTERKSMVLRGYHRGHQRSSEAIRGHPRPPEATTHLDPYLEAQT